MAHMWVVVGEMRVGVEVRTHCIAVGLQVVVDSRRPLKPSMGLPESKQMRYMLIEVVDLLGNRIRKWQVLGDWSRCFVVDGLFGAVERGIDSGGESSFEEEQAWDLRVHEG